MMRPLASVETSSKAISSGAGGTSCSFVGALCSADVSNASETSGSGPSVSPVR